MGTLRAARPQRRAGTRRHAAAASASRTKCPRPPYRPLYTAATWMEALPGSSTTPRRCRASTGLIILDIDRFSVFNDRHGAEVGDRLLVRIGETLRGQSPRAAVSCRYSGERFAVLLPSTPAAEATTLADACAGPSAG
ncbi:MAG: GGDEF domain-containing protein [Arhodomonas sp.]|nr:GGDEF domain-containing protein [Arhodomonas sp.]